MIAMNSSQQTYKNGLFRTGSFVENHDQPRLASLTKDPGVRFAFGFLFFYVDLTALIADS